MKVGFFDNNTERDQRKLYLCAHGEKNGFSFPFTYLMHVSEHYRKAQVLKICIGANDIGTSFQATFPIPVWLIANS